MSTPADLGFDSEGKLATKQDDGRIAVGLCSAQSNGELADWIIMYMEQDAAAAFANRILKEISARVGTVIPLPRRIVDPGLDIYLELMDSCLRFSNAERNTESELLQRSEQEIRDLYWYLQDKIKNGPISPNEDFVVRVCQRVIDARGIVVTTPLPPAVMCLTACGACKVCRGEKP